MTMTYRSFAVQTQLPTGRPHHDGHALTVTETEGGFRFYRLTLQSFHWEEDLVLPGELQHVQELKTHLFSSLKDTRKRQLRLSGDEADGTQTCTYGFDDDGVWRPRSEDKPEAFGSFDQSALIG